MIKSVIFLIIFCCNLFSATTKNWIFDTYESFQKGKLNNVILTEEGELLLSPFFEPVQNISCMCVWDIKSDSKGNIYVATGNEGAIYKIDKDGNTTKFFNVPSIAAFKILVDKNDNLYVSTFTKGLIYNISPEGKAEVFFVFRGDFIWDMIFDKDENLICATGSPGALIKINAKTKKNENLCLVNEMHIITLTKDKNENVYFGTADRGAIYKFSLKNNQLKVIFQPNENEVHTIIYRESDGVIFAATSDKDFYQQPFVQTQQTSPETQPKLKKIVNSVYKISPSGYVQKIIELADTIFLCSTFDKNETLYLGTGDTGIIYTYSKNDKISKFADLNENQVISFLALKDEIFIGTGNPGKVYKFKNSFASNGNYVSEILNASSQANWGKINWYYDKKEGTEITVQTRTGNTSQIDDTWSDWSEEYKNSNGTDITSPPAQYLQFKINFKTSNKNFSPILYKIEIPYILNNRPPYITEISIERANPETSEKSEKTQSTLKIWEIKIKWKASDPDGDKLIYSVLAKIENSTDWFPLKKNLDTPELTVDTRKLPDGLYSFKVIADDIQNNPPGYNLKTEEVFKNWIVDNSPPKILNLSYEKLTDAYKIKGAVKDDLSRIFSISYSVDTENWINIFPKDMIFDSQLEEFEFVYKNSEKPSIIMIMASDEKGNSITAHIKLK